MIKAGLIVILGLATVAIAQRQQQQTPTTTPVPILRQINTHNDDGSYTYGFEAADGSYKIETKAATGEVRGKYGYYDDQGSLREIEYGASRDGFSPSGTGIQVPEAALNKNNGIRSDNPDDYDDGSYRPGPDEAAYRGPQQPTRSAPVSRVNAAARNYNFGPQVPQQQQQQIEQNYYQPQPQQQQQRQQYQPQPQQQQQQQQPAYRQVNLPTNTFQGHPARNINLNSGSYSIAY